MMCVDENTIAAEIDKKECEYILSILSGKIESMENDLSNVDWHKYSLAKSLHGKISAFLKIMEYKRREKRNGNNVMDGMKELLPDWKWCDSTCNCPLKM